MKVDYDIDAERMANKLSKRIYNEPLEKQREDIQNILRQLAKDILDNNLTLESIESLDDE
tara:strand:+ start:709 stop:888 length:180 start_codon:yes stop_codon:yes gene_type:complete